MIPLLLLTITTHYLSVWLTSLIAAGLFCLILSWLISEYARNSDKATHASVSIVGGAVVLLIVFVVTNAILSYRLASSIENVENYNDIQKHTVTQAGNVVDDHVFTLSPIPQPTILNETRSHIHYHYRRNHIEMDITLIGKPYNTTGTLHYIVFDLPHNLSLISTTEPKFNHPVVTSNLHVYLSNSVVEGSVHTRPYFSKSRYHPHKLTATITTASIASGGSTEFIVKGRVWMPICNFAPNDSSGPLSEICCTQLGTCCSKYGICTS